MNDLTKPTLDLSSKVVAKSWDKEVNSYFYDTLELKDLMGFTKSSLIYLPKSVEGKAGDTTTVQVRQQTSKYFYDNASTTFAENQLKWYTDQVKLRQITAPYIIGMAGKSIEQQAVEIDLLLDAKEALATDMQLWLTKSFFGQLSGKAIVDDTYAGTDIDGANALTAATNTLSGTMSLGLIVDAIAMAKKLKFNRLSDTTTGAKFVLYMNPADEATLRKDKDANQISYIDTLAAMAIANKDGKQISADVLGQVFGVELRSNDYVPAGKAYFCGAQAITMVHGSGYRDNKFFDVITYPWEGTKVVAKGNTVLGMKKTVINGKDFGVIELNTGASAKK